mgnify:CR=1 FL=1
MKIIPFLTTAFAGLLIAGSTLAEATDSAIIPNRGATSREPARFWEQSFLSGNGRMGLMYYGLPGDETLVLNHCRLFLPLGNVENVPDIGKNLEELRKIIKERGYNRGMAFMEEKGKQAGWPGMIQNTDPFHPGMMLKINAEGNATEYLRTENFATGEIAARWATGGRQQLRRMFVSRPDNVVVLSLTGDNVTCDFTPLPIDPTAQVRAYQLNHPAEPKDNSAANTLIQSELKIENDGATMHNTYKFGKGGYDIVVRVVTRGGSAESDGQKIRIKEAREVLVLARVVPFKQGEKSRLAETKEELQRLPTDYDSLLAAHARIHGELFNRVVTDFGGGAERKLPSEELFARAKQDQTIPTALLEKIYDGSRYMIICASGEHPPNLQGIWTGTWQPAWSGDYTTNTNLQLAITHTLSSGTPELLQGFFRLIDETLPGWRENAKNFYGARGIMAPSRESNDGRQIHWSSRFHGSFWTCGAGWLAHWYYDYYRYTGDREFLMNQAVPLMKEVALFYEDFLFVDGTGKYRFSPSNSAENGDGDNSTQDIMVAHELLANLIAACQELKIESQSIPKWQAMLDKLPPYLVLPDGELQEWSTPGSPNKNNHRHMSHLYAIWQSYEFDPKTTPEMWKASETAYDARMNGWFRNPENTGDKNRGVETASHGRMHLALSAARLGRNEEVWEILTRMATGGSIYSSMAAAHYENGKTFNMDSNGAMPEVINNALVFSLPGQLDLLPALPAAMKEGEVKGLLARGAIAINRLKWGPGTMEVELTSQKSQTITMRVPKAALLSTFDVIGGKAQVAPAGANARTIDLPAGERVSLSLQFR